MRIENSVKTYAPTCKAIKIYQVKNVAQKAANVAKSFDKKAGFWGTPLRYYAIGMVLPIPFASTTGFIIGFGVALTKKIISKVKRDNPS